MELRQSRAVETQGGKATHDFLSLYASSPPNQDLTPRQGAAAAAFVKTHDFLQPLERVRTEMNLFGAAQNEETSFKLWEETRKENISGGTSLDMIGRQEASSNHNNIFTPISSMKKKRSFIDMITSAKNEQEEEDDEQEEELTVKTEISSSLCSNLKGDVSVKLETHPVVNNSNTSRSKHSATEQRRRSKINDRFLKLREIIPNSDQKRDKASFLLEVIDYIQFLQKKVYRFEGPSPNNVWSHEAAKRNGYGAESVRGRGNEESRPVESLDCMKFDDISYNELMQTNLLNCDGDKTMRWNPSQIQQKISSSGGPEDKNSNNINGRGPTVDTDTINISTIYSQRLLKTINHGLQRCGVNLSQATLSVDINLVKRPGEEDSTSSFISKKQKRVTQAE